MSTPVDYSLSGPPSTTAGLPVTFIVTPGGMVPSDTISMSDGGQGGVFSPTSLTISNSSSPETFTYSQSTQGTYAIVATSADGGTITGSPATLIVSARGSNASRWRVGDLGPRDRRFRRRNRIGG